MGVSREEPENRVCAIKPNAEHVFARLMEIDVYYIRNRAKQICYTNAYTPKRQVIEEVENSKQPETPERCGHWGWWIACLACALILLLVVYLLFNSGKAAELGRKCRMKMAPLIGQLPKSIAPKTDSQPKVGSAKAKSASQTDLESKTSNSPKANVN